MKRYSIFAASLLVSLGVALGVVGVAQANWSDSLRSSNDTVTIAKEDTHSGSLYVGADKVVIDGTVIGDVYCAATEVTVTGMVEGDILCVAQKITVDNGVVRGDVRAVAQEVNLNGGFGSSVSTLTQELRVQENAQIAEDLNGIGQTTTIDGTVLGNVVSAGQSFALNGSVSGNVEVNFASIDLNENAQVDGDLTFSAAKRYAIVNTDSVAGEVTFVPTKQAVDGSDLVGFLLMVTLAMLLTALATAAVIPRFVHRASELLRERTLAVVLFGFAVAFGAPLLALLLMLTVFLAPLAVVVVLVWLLVSMLSGIFFAYYVGSVLLRGVENIIVRMLGGAVALLILYVIPFINIFALFAAWVVGSGMIVMTLTNGYRRPDYSIKPVTATVEPVKKRKPSSKRK